MPGFAERLKDLIANSAVAAAMLDRDMRYLAWSKHWLADYRLGERNLLGVNHYEVFPEIGEDLRALHRRCLSGSTERTGTELFPRQNGRVDVVRRSFHPWHNEDNQVGGLIIFAEVVTEQRQVEEALILSERHLSAIFRESPVPMVVSQLESGLLVDANRALLDLLRASGRTSILGRTSLEIGMISGESRGRLVEALSAHGRVDRFQTPMRRLDGSGFDAELYISSYREGNKQFLLTSVVDITDRKRAEEELAVSRAHYRALFEGANDAIFLHSIAPDGTAGKFVAVNNVAVEQLGYSAAELREMTPADIVEHGWAEHRDRALETLATQGSATFEMVHIAKDGRAIPVEISARRFELGSDPFILAIARDLTARKRAEEEIARLATAIKQAVETIVITDADARVVYANPAFEKSSGYTVAEVIGQNPRILKSGQQDEAFYRQMWTVLSAGETWRGRLQNRRKDGTLYLEDASISPVRDESGRIVNYIALKLDVTRETELQAQLLQAQKMESIGRLAGGIAHDFNNLLTVINGYSKLALGGLTPGDPLRDKLAEIQKAGERAAGLTRQLLAFSRKQILQPRALNFNRVLEDMRNMLERMVGEDVEVRFRLSAESPAVYADPHQLEQVIMNLAVNARDAMPEGGTLTVETGIECRDENCMSIHPEALPGRCAVLSVTDTGVGMSEATQQRIFEPFFTTKGAGRGTGLGLSIVQGVVAQSGGCIRLKSQPGRGSTFQIHLPLLADAVPDECPETAAAVGGRETILVVEDQDQVRSFTVDALKAYGYRVLEAAGADEAVTICQQGRRIHLVLSDVVMPRVSGRELAARLAEVRPDLKVVLMSGYPNDVLPETGARHFLMKPFSPEQLAAKVRAALGQAPAMPRVLVADDEPGVRSFVRAALESAGYHVSEAANGKHVMEHVRTQPVDLVISDLVMPEQEGIETVQALRRELPEIRIIAMSGAFNGQFFGVVKLLGADEVLSKPFTAEMLLEKVEKLLALRSPASHR